MPKERLTWVDTAKGMAILLVVLHHAVLLAHSKPWFDDHMDMLTRALMTVRMPLFFAMSGYFFLRRVGLPWRWQLQNRIGPMLWLYVVWTAIRLVSFDLTPWKRDPEYPITDFVRLFFDPLIGPWYIYALPIYFVLGKVLSSLPVWVQFAVGAVISFPVACGFVSLGSDGWESVLTYFIVFQVGSLGSGGLGKIAARATGMRLCAAFAIWISGVGLLFVADVSLASLWRVPLTAIALVMGVMAAVMVDRHMAWLKMSWFGKRTLPIYVIHVQLICLIYSIEIDLPNNVIVGVLAPLFVVLITVAGALAIWRLTRQIPGLYAAPWYGQGANTRQRRSKARHRKI